MDLNYFSEGNLTDLLKEIEEDQEKEGVLEEGEENQEMEASKRRYQEIIRKHERT